MNQQQRDPTTKWPENLPTQNLAILVMKLAKNVSYYKGDVRTTILNEAARRLVAYRQVERAAAGLPYDPPEEEP